MSEPKTEVRTLAVRVTPDFHALLTMVAQVDDMSLTDLMMKALEGHVEARRQAEDFKAKVQTALAEEQARMARTQALLLGPAPDEAPSETDAANSEPPTTGRSRRGREEAAS